MLGVVRRNPEFRKLWLAQVVSVAGDWLNRIAVLTLIGRLSGPAAATGVGALFGIEVALRLLPTSVFSQLAGPLADRLPRKSLMVAADLLRAGVVLCLLFVREPEHVPLLYGLVLAQTSLAPFFEAARSASLPNTLPATELHEAYALSAATWSAMLAVGAALGGFMIRLVGVSGMFVLDALTYVASAALVLSVRLPATPRQPERFRLRDVVLLTELRRAVAHARERRVGCILAAKTFWGPAGGFLALLSIAGTTRFGDAATNAARAGFATATLYSARGVGTGLGPILARRFMGSDDTALRRQVALGFGVAAVGYSAFAVADRLWVAFLCVAFAHMGGSALWVASTTFWQRKVSDAFRGRVFALDFLGMTVAFSAGGLLAGAVFDATGSIAETTWFVCGLVVLLGATWTLLTRRAVHRTRAADAGGSALAAAQDGPE